MKRYVLQFEVRLPGPGPVIVTGDKEVAATNEVTAKAEIVTILERIHLAVVKINVREKDTSC